MPQTNPKHSVDPSPLLAQKSTEVDNVDQTDLKQEPPVEYISGKNVLYGQEAELRELILKQLSSPLRPEDRADVIMRAIKGGSMSNQSELDTLLNDYLNACIYQQGSAWEQEENIVKTKQAILDLQNKRIEEVLDRLYSEVLSSDYLGINAAIRAERNKLNNPDGDAK